MGGLAACARQQISVVQRLAQPTGTATAVQGTAVYGDCSLQGLQGLAINHARSTVFVTCLWLGFLQVVECIRVEPLWSHLAWLDAAIPQLLNQQRHNLLPKKADTLYAAHLYQGIQGRAYRACRAGRAGQPKCTDPFRPSSPCQARRHCSRNSTACTACQQASFTNSAFQHAVTCAACTRRYLLLHTVAHLLQQKGPAPGHTHTTLYDTCSQPSASTPRVAQLCYT